MDIEYAIEQIKKNKIVDQEEHVEKHTKKQGYPIKIMKNIFFNAIQKMKISHHS